MDARPACLINPGGHLPIAAGAMELAKEIVLARSPGVVTAKGDRDMVSDVGVQIERAVRGYMRERSPEVGFLGEEEGNALGEGELQWVLDPIDGTANFVKGMPLHSISLALIKDKEPVLGVIDVRARGGGTRLPPARALFGPWPSGQ